MQWVSNKFWNSFLNKIDFSEFNITDQIELYSYGSYMYGFGTLNSDIDSMLCT